MNPISPVLPTNRRVQRVRHELRRRALTVLRVQPVGAGFVGVTFGGDDLADFVSLSFDDHVKFMLDGAGGEPVRRDYTPRHVDVARRELTIEFALHGHGQASAWARQAAPGQQVVIGGPRGSMVIAADHDWHLLAGDATALPAIARRVEELPAGARALVLVQVADPADQRLWHSAATVSSQWLPTSDAWLAALRGLTLPPGDGFAWCAGEAAVMAQARAVLRDVHHLPREAMRVAAYWKQGTAAHHDTLDD